MPAIDRDESRFAQASRGMLEATAWQGWMIPRIQGRLRLNKPPMIYWMQAGSASLFTGRVFGATPEEAILHDAIWMYRLPSLLAAIAAVLFTWRLGCSMFDSRAGFLGAMLLAASPVMIWESRQGRADMLLVACTTGAMWALWEGFKQSRAHGVVKPLTWISLWLAVGAGAMTKGPITAMIVLLTTLGISFLMRSMRWTWALKPLGGTVIVEGCVVPWIIIVMDMIGGHNYWTIVSNEILGRMGKPAEGHGGPPGYHALLMVALLGAGSMLVWPALARAWRVGITSDPTKRWIEKFWSLRMGRPAEAFLLCWLILPWIVFEISSTKLPHYTMPMYPALALLAARMVLAADAGKHPFKQQRLVRGLVWVWLGALTLALFAFGMLAIYATWRSLGSVPSMTIAAVWMMGAGVLVFKGVQFHMAGQWLFLQRTGIAISVGVALALGIAGSLLPEIRTSRNLANALGEIDPTRTRPIVAVDYDESAPKARDWGGYVEDSLIFETLGRATRLKGPGLDDWINANPTGLICIEAQALKRYMGIEKNKPLPEELTGTGHLHILGMVPGFNYTKNQRVNVYIAEARP